MKKMTAKNNHYTTLQLPGENLKNQVKNILIFVSVLFMYFPDVSFSSFIILHQQSQQSNLIKKIGHRNHNKGIKQICTRIIKNWEVMVSMLVHCNMQYMEVGAKRYQWSNKEIKKTDLRSNFSLTSSIPKCQIYGLAKCGGILYIESMSHCNIKFMLK